MSENHKYTVTRVMNGKKIPPPLPKPIPLTNGNLFRLADHGLYALRQKKDEYVYSNILYNDQSPETLTRIQIDYLTKLYQGVNKYLEDNPLSNPTNHRITKSYREKTIKFGTDYKSYANEMSNLDLPSYLTKACEKLIDFVLELVMTFNFIDNLITDKTNLPNRPADIRFRKQIHKIILDYQHEKQTTKFPTYPYVIKAVNNIQNNESKIQLSPRQYFNFKIWLMRGTYYWFIQP